MSRMRNPKKTAESAPECHVSVAVFCAFSFLLCLAGCTTRCMCPKERSHSIAMELLREPCTADASAKINHCTDVDALRIVAFAAHATSWPGEAGPDAEFDTGMDQIALMALPRLFAIDSEAADETIEFYNRSFPPDGGYGVFFREEEARRRNSRKQSP